VVLSLSDTTIGVEILLSVSTAGGLAGLNHSTIEAS
jgi:hypothetical protein